MLLLACTASGNEVLLNIRGHYPKAMILFSEREYCMCMQHSFVWRKRAEGILHIKEVCSDILTG